MASGLGSIEDISDQKIKIEHYKQRLSEIFDRKDEQDITAFVDHSKPVRNTCVTCYGTCSLCFL